MGRPRDNRKRARGEDEEDDGDAVWQVYSCETQRLAGLSKCTWKRLAASFGLFYQLLDIGWRIMSALGWMCQIGGHTKESSINSRGCGSEVAPFLLCVVCLQIARCSDFRVPSIGSLGRVAVCLLLELIVASALSAPDLVSASSSPSVVQ